MTQKKSDAETKTSEQKRADFIRNLAELLNETNLSEIEYDEPGGFRLRLARQMMAAPLPPAVMMPNFAPQAAPAALPSLPDAAQTPPPALQGGGVAHGHERLGVVTSPMVGTVYLSPEPGVEPFVKLGDIVNEGQTLLIIEAMKVMNPFQAPHKGKITEIIVKDSQPVEFGEALIVISPV